MVDIDNINHKGMNSLPYSSKVIAHRKRVLKFVYEARRLAKLPYVHVRITNSHPSVLAFAWTGGIHQDNSDNKYVIWVSERAINCPDSFLRAIVWHELIHAVYGAPDVIGDALMAPTIDTNVSYETLKERFIAWSRWDIRQEYP